jgi:hypothetical protein
VSIKLETEIWRIWLHERRAEQMEMTYIKDNLDDIRPSTKQIALKWSIDKAVTVIGRKGNTTANFARPRVRDLFTNIPQPEKRWRPLGLKTAYSHCDAAAIVDLLRSLACRPSTPPLASRKPTKTFSPFTDSPFHVTRNETLKPWTPRPRPLSPTRPSPRRP